ncbi:MAG: phosphoribosylaminoimidazolesuccinocarboxamide synthase [Defluviitaleaceae bacterium]|nr:phosphoribosylaminoimidazolesuccinocarboxamide synthase [Defluviitaleaceae bacterium]
MIQCNGRGKEVLESENKGEVIVRFTDQATAFHDVKRAIVPGKGAVINAISIRVFERLEQNGIKTHFIKKLNHCEQLCHEVEMISLNVVVRNVVSGSMAKRLGVQEGYVPEAPVYEIFYKNLDIANPLINEDHALALGIATADELTMIREQALKINEILKPFFADIDINLVDFKIEFGRNRKGELLLADEISPDKSRLWDIKTGEQLDKDHFSRDLGDVKEAYEKILMRLVSKESN